MSNLKQIMNGFAMYTQDYDEVMVSSPNLWGVATADNPWIFWPHQLQPYIKNWQVYHCPSLPLQTETDYWYMRYPVQPNYSINDYIRDNHVSMAAVQKPADKLLIGDSNHPALGSVQGWMIASSCGGWGCGENVSQTHNWRVPHNGGLNFGYIDGHVKWLNANKVWTDINDPNIQAANPVY